MPVQKAHLQMSCALLCLLAFHASITSTLAADLHSSSIFQNYFQRFLPPPSHPESQPSRPHAHALQTETIPPILIRRTLAEQPDDDPFLSDDTTLTGMSAAQIRAKISQHKILLARLKQESKDLAHERSFLEKTLELKKGQRNMQDGQVKLSKAELEDKAKEIEMYKREAPRTLLRYNELVRKQKEMQETLNRLHAESEELSTSKKVMMEKIHNLNMEDLIERHARGLPDAMAGALRKSAAALIPFFDYLMIAADTNSRLVDHVGAEIDKYTHVNISESPFMSGILFYCVLLIPLLTFVSFIRRVFDSSSRLTASHYIILGNLYFVFMCVVNVLAALYLREDPTTFLFRRYERFFVIGNLFLSVYYVWHVVMLGLQALYTLEKRNISQFLATLSVGIHYFLFTWRRVFTDHAPMMYTFNYLVYGTIFCFILYERYHRMSKKQLNDSVLFRIFQIIIKRRPHMTNVQALKAVLLEIIATIIDRSKLRSRKFSKRYDKYTGAERKSKAEGRDRHKSKSKSSSISDEEQGMARLERKNDGSSLRNGKSRSRGQSSRRVNESRGFVSIFFGSPENGEDSSEEEVSPQRNGWNLFGRSRTNSVKTERNEEPADVIRGGRAVRSHRSRSGKETRNERRSIWKWS